MRELWEASVSILKSADYYSGNVQFGLVLPVFLEVGYCNYGNEK